MESFNTIEKVRDLFEQKGMNRTSNCYFIGYRDTTKEGIQYGLLGGVVGGVVGATLSALVSGTLSGMEKYDGYIFNYTEDGLGIIPMNYKGVMLIANPSKMVPDLEKAAFVKNEGIESIVAKNFNIFNSKVKRVKIVFKDGNKIVLTINSVEKDIPYHQSCFDQFFQRYKNK